MCARPLSSIWVSLDFSIPKLYRLADFFVDSRTVFTVRCHRCYNSIVSFQVAGHQTEGYQVATEVYEGPLDLLLELIERAELDITTLALAQVTDQYLAYLRALQERDAAEVSAFLVIAARLVQIKSQRSCHASPSTMPGMPKRIG